MMTDTPDTSGATGLSIDIAVCTFRRRELDATLASLSALRVPPGAAIRVIVADNDIVPSAEERVAKIAATMPFAVSYLHCPASNISVARNACLDACEAEFLAFIDDDETATPDWLCALAAKAEARSADVVLGPVRALYGAAAPAWMRQGDLHSTRPVWVNGEIITGYTCNVLLRTGAPSLRGRRFNLALGRTGGEDTEFFTHVHREGGRIAFAPKAWVEEPVPAQRARLVWLVKRRFRFGQTYGRLLKQRGGLVSRIRNIGLAFSKAGFCTGMAILLAFSRPRSAAYALRGAMHVGVVCGLLGLGEIRQYGIVGVEA